MFRSRSCPPPSRLKTLTLFPVLLLAMSRLAQLGSKGHKVCFGALKRLSGITLSMKRRGFRSRSNPDDDGAVGVRHKAIRLLSPPILLQQPPSNTRQMTHVDLPSIPAPPAGPGWDAYSAICKHAADTVRILFPAAFLTKGDPDERIDIPSRDNGRTIKAHIYAPKGYKIGGGEKLPVLVNFHGSGFIIDMFGSDQDYCRFVADKANVVVVDCDYRKAPETMFPGAVWDAEDAVKWVVSQKDRFNVDKLAVSGFSAGGNLSLVMSTVGQFPKGTIKAAAAIYPVTDLSVDPFTKVPPDTRLPCIPPATEHLFDACYIPTTVDRKDLRLSPSHAPADLFPKYVTLITASCDNLAPEVAVLAQKIDDGSREVAHKMFDGVDHQFDKKAVEGTAEAKIRDEAWAMVADMLQKAFA